MRRSWMTDVGLPLGKMNSAGTSGEDDGRLRPPPVRSMASTAAAAAQETNAPIVRRPVPDGRPVDSLVVPPRESDELPKALAA